MTVLRIGVLLLVLCPTGALAGDHKPVSAYDLEDGKLYIARYAGLLRTTAHPATDRFGVVYLPRGANILKVLRRARHKGELVYRVERKQPGTLDRSQHIRVWIRAKYLAWADLFEAW